MVDVDVQIQLASLNKTHHGRGRNGLAHRTGLKERVGGALNLVPEPLGLAMFAMPVTRSLQVAQRTGMIAELASGAVEGRKRELLCGLLDSVRIAPRAVSALWR